MTDTVIGSATREVVIGFERPFVIIGERINPTGRKKLAAFTLHTLGRESAIFRTHNFAPSSNSLNEILQTKDIINLSIQSLHLATVRDHEILKNILIKIY
mgnify:CR=1 FL=1